jgi:hypothetical protein
MFILGRVTTVAGIRDAHQLIIDVASLTFHIHVSTFQSEARERVINGCITPARWIVTTLALVAKPTFMDIVSLVTGAAVSRGCLQDRQCECVPMTASTIHTEVCPFERIIGRLMVKTTRKTVEAIMTYQAIKTEHLDMLDQKSALLIQMARPAGTDIERSYRLGVAGETGCANVVPQSVMRF